MKTLRWDSINPATGRRYTWDDPNLRWGSPSYVLEPGDPGYTPPEPSSPASTGKSKQRNSMKHHVYYPVRTADQIVWLENFRNKLGAYASALGLAAPRVTEAINDARWLVYVLGTFLPAVRAFSLACTQAGKQAQSGAGGPLALPVFTPPALPAGVTAADEGALSRTFDLVAEINESNGCTPAMCADLRIVGPEITGPDPATFRPELTLTVNVNSVFIGWGWGGFSAFLDQLEIQVDRGDGKGFQTLTYDTTPNYTDNHPFPPTLTRWHYRGIYRVDDSPFGQWSETVTVVVGG